MSEFANRFPALTAPRAKLFPKGIIFLSRFANIPPNPRPLCRGCLSTRNIFSFDIYYMLVYVI